MAGFFERVLPRVGPYTLFSGATGVDGTLIECRHWNGLQSIAEIEAEVTRLSMLPLNVYYATGNYAGPNRRDPISKRAFWLDLDPKGFGSKESALRELGIFLKATGLPKPSIYVDSGNGMHVYWCLDRDLPIAEWVPIAEALKAKCAELQFPADRSPTATPAQILRAPGTLNRKSSTPLPCRVVMDNDTVYAPDDLARQLEVSPVLTGITSVLNTLVSNDDLVSKRDYENKSADEVRDMLSYVQLPPAGNPECRDLWIRVMMAVQDWSEKSEQGFEILAEWSATQPGFVSVEACRKTWDSFEPGGGIGIGTLIMIAREAGWGEIVVTAGPDASFAEQIAAAVPNPAAPSSTTAPVVAVQHISPLLSACAHAVQATNKDRFKLKEAVPWLSNEFVLILEQESILYSLTERVILSKTVIDDLLTRFMPFNKNHKPITPSSILRDYGMVGKNIVNELGFYPGQPMIYAENDKAYVNLYTEPAAKIYPTDEEAELVNDLWGYLFPTDKDQDFGDYLMRFYGHIVQKPHIKITSAPLMVSEKTGTGKTTAMWDIPRALVGEKNSRTVSNKVLRSQFSDYVNGAQFLHFDEIHINGRWDSDDTANALKNIITGKTIEVHPKGLKPYNIPNRLFTTATSNYIDAVSLPREDERRWGIYYLKPIRVMTDLERENYFKTFHNWLESPRGPGVLRYIFDQVDISHFNPHAPPPMTDAKYAMVAKSQATEVQIIADAVKDNDGPFSRECWTLDQVRQWVQAETGKKYPGATVRAFIERAIPSAKMVREIRDGDNAKTRVWAHLNYEYWSVASVDELRKCIRR